ncbi:MAG: hypothetical protein Q8922_03705 [Bacteroidota bacterium]|nr:hypothetical protein [Bacteroidota bacterium]MDP4233398.1 hypothetical protein [Bacteroidota bacterium]MDP4242264.1 hypothetical protein [Bacteroidota bacterium]MDP4287020.1 hypothetical protein [Bacteroidota bacterium]
MRTIIIPVVLTMLLATDVQAQDSTRVQRIEYVVGASLTFALADYLGWNLDIYNHPGNSKVVYRSLQLVAQAAISYFLYKTCGLNSAIAFNLVWWTWGDDLAFYGYQLGINPAAPWPNRNLDNNLRDNAIRWAGWTPIGLMRPPNSIIPRDALYGQAAVGFALSMSILW